MFGGLGVAKANFVIFYLICTESVGIQGLGFSCLIYLVIPDVEGSRYYRYAVLQK